MLIFIIFYLYYVLVSSAFHKATILMNCKLFGFLNFRFSVSLKHVVRTHFDIYVSIIYLPIDIPFGHIISSSTIMILSVPSIRQRSILGLL